MNQLRDPLLRKSLAPAAHADEFGQVVRSTILADFWPGIQLYYPPVKYAPALGIYEDLDAAAQRFKKHAHNTLAHTLIFDLEDGCRQKEMSRDLLHRELPALPRRRNLQIALRVNPFRTDEYEKDMALIRDLSDHVDVVMLAKAGEAYGAAEIRDLSGLLAAFNHGITIQPIIEHPKSLKIAPEIMQYATVKHVVFGIHDFSKAMGIQITPERWTEELRFFLNQVMFEARIAGKGVIGGVETLIGQAVMPEKYVENHDVRRWLDLHGDHESRIVYQHACEEASMGLTGKQVIHPGHIHLCKVAYTPSPSDVAQERDPRGGDRGRRAARRRDQVRGRDARPADVRQGAADAAPCARAARAVRRRHRVRTAGAAEAAGAGDPRELAVRRDSLSDA